MIIQGQDRGSEGTACSLANGAVVGDASCAFQVAGLPAPGAVGMTGKGRQRVMVVGWGVGSCSEVTFLIEFLVRLGRLNGKEMEPTKSFRSK